MERYTKRIGLSAILALRGLIVADDTIWAEPILAAGIFTSRLDCNSKSAPRWILQPDETATGLWTSRLQARIRSEIFCPARSGSHSRQIGSRNVTRVGWYTISSEYYGINLIRLVAPLARSWVDDKSAGLGDTPILPPAGYRSPRTFIQKKFGLDMVPCATGSRLTGLI